MWVSWLNLSKADRNDLVARLSLPLEDVEDVDRGPVRRTLSGGSPRLLLRLFLVLVVTLLVFLLLVVIGIVEVAEEEVLEIPGRPRKLGTRGVVEMGPMVNGGLDLLVPLGLLLTENRLAIRFVPVW